jgi:hypothetical protein
VCKGNVGKPPGKFIWKKLRHGEQVLLFTQMSVLRQLDGSQTSTHTADEHTPRSQAEDALSIGGYHVDNTITGKY